MDEEEDCVVRELDVYVCNESVGAQLCLLAHPLRPPWRPYDYDRVKTMRFKPQAKRMEVDLPLDMHSANYNNDEESTDASSSYKRVNHITLRSNLVEAKSALAMGTIQDGKLLLAPLDYSIQMRPNLAYLNVSKKGRDAEEGDEDEGEEGEKEPTMRAVEVQVQKRETERQQQARLNSFAYISQLEEEEPWKVLNLHHAESVPAERVWNRIMSPATEKPPLPHMDRATYLQSFIPSSGNINPVEDWSREPAAPPPGTAESISDEARGAFPAAMKTLFAKHTVCSIANVRTWLTDSKFGAGTAKEAATLTDRALHELVIGSGVPVVCIRRMYVLKQTGKPELDQFRKIVIDMLLDKEGFKRSEVTEAANSQGVAVTDSLYNKVVKDICQSRGQLWSLKNGADGL